MIKSRPSYIMSELENAIEVAMTGLLPLLPGRMFIDLVLQFESHEVDGRHRGPSKFSTGLHFRPLDELDARERHSDPLKEGQIHGES